MLLHWGYIWCHSAHLTQMSADDGKIYTADQAIFNLKQSVWSTTAASQLLSFTRLIKGMCLCARGCLGSTCFHALLLLMPQEVTWLGLTLVIGQFGLLNKLECQTNVPTTDVLPMLRFSPCFHFLPRSLTWPLPSTSWLVPVLLLACPVWVSSLFSIHWCQIPLRRPKILVSLGQTSIGVCLTKFWQVIVSGILPGQVVSQLYYDEASAVMRHPQ